MKNSVISAAILPDMLDFLQRRRSSKLANIGSPGPATDQIGTILEVASRVPDHGKLHPWRFIVLKGEGRVKAGEWLREAWRQEDPAASPAKLDLEAERFQRAPLIIAVVSSPKEAKTPEWEQILSAGAACFSLCLAANAMGFATAWVTEWYAYNHVFKKAMGLNDRERFAGFIYIGTAMKEPEERDRPALASVVQYME